MEFYKLNKKTARQVTLYKSDFLMNPLMHLNSEIRISIMTLKENGIIGLHQAKSSQLLYVLEGEGVACNEDRKYYPIQKGIAIFWKKEEWHETKSENGLVALVIEGFEISKNNIFLDPF